MNCRLAFFLLLNVLFSTIILSSFFLLVKDVIALLSNGLLRYIFMFNTDQCFFIFFETFRDALLKRKVNAILFSIFLFFLVLRGSPLLETFPFYICLIRCVTLSNKFLQRILGMVFKDTLKACFWLFIWWMLLIK